MQRIERYGVIALLLLLVTVLAVSMWGEEPVDAKDSSTHTLASVTPAKRETATRRQTPTRTTRANTNARRSSQVESGVPLSSKTRTAQVETRPVAVTNTRGRNINSNRLRVGERRNQTATPANNRRNHDLTSGNSGTNTVKRKTQPAVVEPSPLKVASDLVVTQASKFMNKLKPAVTRKLTSAKAATWTVKSGETLSEISQEALGSASLWRKIAAANPSVDPNRLSVGTELVLPTGAALAVSAKPTTKKVAAFKPRAATSAGGSYTVQSGDVLSMIAQRELGSSKRWREIVSLNPSVDPNRLAVGTQLVLPAGGVARATQPVSSNSLAVVRAKKPTVKRNRVR